MFPNPNTRITLDTSMLQAMTLLSDGNPGAIQTLLGLFSAAPAVDPQGAMGGFGPLLLLDSLGIYGPGIYVLGSDICGRNSARLLAVLRAVQLGLVPAETVQQAAQRQDYSGRELVPVLPLYQQLRKRLPTFDAQGAAGYSPEELAAVFVL